MSVSLSFEAPLPLTADAAGRLSDMLGKVYQYCLANQVAGTVGRADVTWDLDLRASSLTLGRSSAPDRAPEQVYGLGFTPYIDARKEVVGTHFELRLARGTETYFVRERVGFTAIQNYLTGNEFERTFTPPLPDPIEASEWDRWGQGVTAEICGRYETVIYPRVIDTLTRVGDRTGRPMRVVDLGGGAGQLSELVCARVPGVSQVRLVDRSAALIEQARLGAARFPQRLTTVCADVTDDSVARRELAGAPDVVILCGVVAQQVMHHDQGVRLMRTCFERLAPGGFVLVPSYSAALLGSREYEAMGFTVHNKTLSVIEEDPRRGRLLQTNDFYILEKR